MASIARRQSVPFTIRLDDALKSALECESALDQRPPAPFILIHHVTAEQTEMPRLRDMRQWGGI